MKRSNYCKIQDICTAYGFIYMHKHTHIYIHRRDPKSKTDTFSPVHATSQAENHSLSIRNG